MRIFVAGATGAIGVRLVTRLVQEGYIVAGLTRTPMKAALLAELGAEPIICNVYAAGQLCEAMVAFAPQLVLHQLTDLPDRRDLVREHMSANARMRREGTHNLFAAADAAGVTRVLAQSVAFNLSADAAAAVRDLETVTLARDGVVLRYGQFYGPDTYYEAEPPSGPRVHIDEAAEQTLLALDAPSGVLDVVDSERTARAR